MRFRAYLLGLALVLELGLVASLNLFDDWTVEFNPVKFAAIGMLAGIAFFAAASTFEVIKQRRTVLAVFWSITILLRLAALPLRPGDDLWRYEWEGKIQEAGFNPYVLAPDDPKLVDLRDSFEHWGQINHREYKAIYPPGAELLLRLLSRLSDSTLFYKLVFTAGDLAVVALLLVLFRNSGEREPWKLACWYAWNPLVVYSFAGSAHFDSLMILSMMGGLYFITRSRMASFSLKDGWGLAFLASVCLGIAISLKLVPIFLLPLCAAALGFRAITLVVSVGLPGLLSLSYGWPQIPIWKSLALFAQVGRLNDLFWWLIEGTLWPNPWQKNYQHNLITLGLVLALSLLFCRNWQRGLLWVLGLVLILSPVMHPWYCTWILPIAAWRRAHGWQVLSITLFAYFLFWDERLFLLPWHADPWMRAIIIAPPLAASVLLLSSSRKSALSETLR